MILARSSRDPFLAPFTGPVRLTESFLVMPRNGAPRLAYLTPMDRREARASGLDLLTPEDLDVERWNRDGARPHELLANVLSRALFLCGLAPGRLALAGCVEAGRLAGACELLAAEGWSFVPGEPAVVLLRKRKTPPQVEALRRVAAGTAAAFRAAAELLAGAGVRDVGPPGGELWRGGEPLTVARLRRAVRRVLSEHGLEEPEGSIVAPAEEGAVPHTSGTPGRVLRPGESLVVDLFPCDRRGAPFADCTRTFCVGEPPEALAAAHAAVFESLAAAYREARPDVTGWQLQRRACGGFAEAGYATVQENPETVRGYVHGLGHGVGYELHELPSFRRAAELADGRLETGDLFTLEPGLYDPGASWGLRLEDLCVLGPAGVQNLTPAPYFLDPRAWSDRGPTG